MLPKQYRIPKENYRSNNFGFIKSKSFSLKTLPNQLSHPRAGIIVSKKISNKAVIRNKIKRRLFSIINPWIKQAHSPIDLIFLTKTNITDKNQEELEKEFNAIKLKINEATIHRPD